MAESEDQPRDSCQQSPRRTLSIRRLPITRVCNSLSCGLLAGPPNLYAWPIFIHSFSLTHNNLARVFITVVIFSKTYCPFCTATKDLFAGLGVEAKIIELDNMANGSEIQAALQELSGQRTVPNTFVDGKHLGGNEDVQKAALFGDLKKQLGL